MIVDKYGNYVRKFMWQLCGWGRVDICMTFRKRAFDFSISLHVDLTILNIARLMNCYFNLFDNTSLQNFTFCLFPQI
jgi:hypothetical protein